MKASVDVRLADTTARIRTSLNPVDRSQPLADIRQWSRELNPKMRIALLARCPRPREIPDGLWCFLASFQYGRRSGICSNSCDDTGKSRPSGP